MSDPASIHREDREAIGVATIPLLKSPPRDRVLRGVGVYFQPENPIQVLRRRRIRITHGLAFVLSQHFPFNSIDQRRGIVFAAAPHWPAAASGVVLKGDYLRYIAAHDQSLQMLSLPTHRAADLLACGFAGVQDWDGLINF